jgi:tripartite-type tricarboxylate transporter receptor subunit TctC
LTEAVDSTGGFASLCETELTYASSGIGSPHQIFAEEFKIMTSTDIHHIPYKGAVPGLTDIASGNVSMEFVDIPPALPLIQAGKLKVLAVLSARGNPELPGVPPLAETVPGYDASSWQGFFARAGTPQPIIDKLNAALAADFKRPETAERFTALGIVAQWDTPAEFATFITEQSANWGKVIRAAGITPQ